MIAGEKKTLRREMRRRLQDFPPEQRRHEEKTSCSLLFSMEEWKRCSRLLVFISMEEEFNTGGFIDRAIMEGKGIWIPRMHGRIIRFHLLSPAGNPAEVPDRPPTDLQAGHGDLFDPRLYGLERNSYGIWEPPADYESFDAGSGERTIVIVPGLAFDRRGYRLGRGRGYYDRWLAEIQDSCAADTFSPIGIGYSIQLVPKVPRDRYDVPLPLLIAGSAVIRRPDAG